MSIPTFRPFTLSLIQLGSIGINKSDNLKHAREMILRAARGRSNKPDMIVLPECFNSPYGHVHFPVYAEKIGESESNCSIPERDATTDHIYYNTCTVYNPQGDLVATHRKVHLFDIDIPGKIKFKESETLTAGKTLNFFDTGSSMIFSRNVFYTLIAKILLGSVLEYATIFVFRKWLRYLPGMVAIILLFAFGPLLMTKGCHVLIYPSAFNMTTGPLHWELLQRARY
ncbi:carbon-nitrogen hydrolase [Infundibulicybe gibba]|nr:carbon-nitrogen hydrolase [Infundibulicybe gibba]